MKKTLWLLAALCVAVCFSVTLYAENDTAPVSPALNIIAADRGMAKAGLLGETLIFSEDDFCRALNLSKVETIKITSLPDSKTGRLLLGTTAVSVGQTVTRANLALLAFAPSSESELKSSFRFIVGEFGYEIECSIYMLKYVNAAPFGESAEICADAGVATASKLVGVDPEKDGLRFEIIKYPEHGLLILGENGEYKFYPKTGYVGEDRFIYVVIDEYGNYSAAKTVTLSVE